MTRMSVRRRSAASPRRSDREHGQGIVEFTMILPLLLLLLTGVVEFGLIANDALTVGYGSREGARAGAALGDGGATSCTGDGDPGAVDATVVAAIQRIVKSQGSAVAVDDIREIRIFKATSSGAMTDGSVNTWRYTGPTSGPDVDPGPGTARVDFSPVTVQWPACARENGGVSPDSIGVEVVYERALVTPIASLLPIFTGGQDPRFVLSETTVMALNPTF